MISTEGKFEFSVEKMREEFDILFVAWKSTWAPSGPFRIRHETLLTEAQVLAEKPEVEAYQKLLDYCATVVTLSTLEGKQKETIDSITQYYDAYTGKSGVTAYYKYFINDLFKKAMELLHSMTKVEDKNLHDLIAEQRGKLGSTLNFGMIERLA